MMRADSLPQPVKQTIDALAHYEMLAPAALFVAGHRPLAFISGQLCYMAAPLNAFSSSASLYAWAAVLSDPAATDQLVAALNVQLREARRDAA